MSRSKRLATPAKAKEILRYFLRNPGAADTLEGVARWRLMDERIHGTVEETDQALAWLVAEGLLLKESRDGLDPTFCLSPEQGDRARLLLGKARKPWRS
ncbi:MAG TPA: hypothetical protein VMU47_23840 [Caldimonas sp.]|nr:hypothetical protein [Caldimonas sp.]